MVCGLYYSQAELPHFSRESEIATDVEGNTKTFHIIILSNARTSKRPSSPLAKRISNFIPVTTVHRFHTVQRYSELSPCIEKCRTASFALYFIFSSSQLHAAHLTILYFWSSNLYFILCCPLEYLSLWGNVKVNLKRKARQFLFREYLKRFVRLYFKIQ